MGAGQEGSLGEGAVKHEDLSLRPRTHTLGDNLHLQDVFFYTLPPTHTHLRQTDRRALKNTHRGAGHSNLPPISAESEVYWKEKEKLLSGKIFRNQNVWSFCPWVNSHTCSLCGF